MSKHGRYNIVRRVADGGMAEIFLATQVGRDGFQKPVILKRIHNTIYADPQFRNMFVDEAHISMSLAHSNIAQVLDLGVAAGRYFLVLELVDGWDLGRVLQRAATAGIPLPRELGLHITADVCRALAYAHGKTDGQRPLGIVHRDVSPHNVLLSEQGEVKLTDFGIAKAMNKREHTGTGVVKGKVAFMSPEQAMGKPIDQRSDIFSLGTMLYLLMVRSRPFEGPTDLETLLRVQKGDYTPPEAVAPDLEPEVAAIINRSMKLDPAERYQSADDMLTDLERVLRTVFQPVGQTELKRWLHDLSAHDGHPSIGKAPERLPSARHGTGELEGKDVVLSDSQDMDDEEVIDGEAVTSLAVVEGGGGAGRMRLSRHRRCPCRATRKPTSKDAPARSWRYTFPTSKSRPAAAARVAAAACSKS
jgi:serine/threonine protein kinase